MWLLALRSALGLGAVQMSLCVSLRPLTFRDNLGRRQELLHSLQGQRVSVQQLEQLAGRAPTSAGDRGGPGVRVAELIEVEHSSFMLQSHSCCLTALSHLVLYRGAFIFRAT